MLFAYLENALKDLRLFFYVWILLNIYRIAFMWIMQEYISDGGYDDVVKSISSGALLSLKTAGFATLFSYAFVTLPKTFAGGFKKKLPKVFDRLREKIGVFWIFVFTFLFLARFPYYKAFNGTYDWQIFMGLNDDVVSIINMMFAEYGFLWRLPLAFLLLYGLYKCLIKWINFDFLDKKILTKLPKMTLKKELASLLAAVTFSFFFGMFMRFGGAFSYAAGINWENAQSLSDKFLNECMLDDGQALYRAYSAEMRMMNDELVGVYPASIDEFAGGEDIKTADDLAKYLEKEAKGAKIERPDHIFIIVGETFAAWPLFDKYESLNVGSYIKTLSKEPNAYFYKDILPNGEYTAVALNGFITGLMDTGVRINYQPRSYEEPYATALAPQMKKLGYQTSFWYGGALEWDRMGELAKAQGFDAAYGYPEFHAKKQNTWGTTDKALFDAIYNSLETSPSSLHLIMTVSNHPPYNLDLAAEGIDAAAIEERLENYPDIPNIKDLAMELAYYSYMDKEIYNFIKQTYEKYPKSLFIVTGDHNVRISPCKIPTDREFITVPLLFYGYGVHQNLLNKSALPSHVGVIPTLAELIAPKGFKYYSINPNFFEARDYAVMDRYYMTKFEVRRLYKEHSSGKAAYESFRAKTLSWWLMFK